MTIIARPMFLDNPDWYKYDETQGKYVLTENATEEARESYDSFYKALSHKFIEKD